MPENDSLDEQQPTKMVTKRGRRRPASTDAQRFRGARERRAAGLPPAESSTNVKPPHCGALIRPGNARYVEGADLTCTLRAGHGTDHVGVGRCKYHGGCNPVKTGRYSKIKRLSLREAVDRFSDDEDPMDLLPEVHLLRALTEDYVNRYDEIIDALLRWNAEEQAEADEERRRPQIMTVPDLTQAGELLEKVSRIAERVDKIKNRSAITVATLQRVVEQFGVAVAKHVHDPQAIDAIERDWSLISID